MSLSMGDYLSRFAARWPEQVGNLVSYRLSPLLGTSVCFRVTDGPSYTVFFGERELTFKEGEALRPHATVAMSWKDWEDVLTGRVGIMSVVMAGRCPYPKHERYVLAKLSVVLQSLATLEGGSVK